MNNQPRNLEIFMNCGVTTEKNNLSNVLHWFASEEYMYICRLYVFHKHTNIKGFHLPRFLRF